MKRIISIILITSIILTICTSFTAVFASSASEVTQALDDIKSIYDGKYWNAYLQEDALKNAVANGYSTPYNNYSMNERMEKLGLTTSGCKSSSQKNGTCTSNMFDDGIQCNGFARFIFYYLYEKKVSSITQRGTNISVDSLQPGDFIRTPSDHSAIVWKIEGDTLYCVEAWGSYNTRHDGCIIKFTKGFNGGYSTTSANAMLKYLKNNNGFFARVDNLVSRKAYNWQETFSRITNQTASLKSSKKNYKINVYNAPYEDATKTTSKKPVEKFAIVGTVTNAYGNEWYAIDYPDDEKKVCYTAYIYSKTLTDNYDIITTTVQEAKKYDSANTITATHTHNYNYNNGQCYCGAVKSTSQQTNAASTLKINLTKYPVQHTQGKNFGLRGTISSNYNIKKIYGYIKQNGNIIQSTEDSPNAKSVDVKEKRLNNNLIFETLGAGNYTLEVYAVDASGNGLTVTKNFTVVGQTDKAESTLSINLDKYPVTLNAGNGFGLRGSVTSNYNIALVRGYIINSSGQTVLSSKDTPNSTSMDIRYANLNNDLVFNNLGAGNYTMKVVATDNSGKSVEVSKAFTVVSNTDSNNSSLSINLEKYPVTINVGSSYGLRGSITSNYNISLVRGYVINSNGQTVLSSKDTPYSTYMDIKPAHLNADLIFNNLSAGNYTMKVVAVDASGRTVEATKNFTVKAKEAYVDNTPNGNGVTGTVAIPSSWDNLSIRSGPSTNYQVVGSMNNGVQCTVYPNKTSNGWYYVNYNGIWGYASGNQINLNSSSTSNTRTGIVNIPSSWTDLSIRTGPSTNYQIVGGMPQGARCTVYPDKASNGWYYVEYNGISGYAAGNRINLQ